jgi:L-alanine-DL-glutamate epimerase-like enolase superfamily enzyme
LCFVNVNLDNGLQGLGQTAPFSADISAMIMHKQIAQAAIGKELSLGSSPAEIEANVRKFVKAPLAAGSPGELCETIAWRNYKHLGSHLYRTLAGLDTAIWDALGKLAGKPVCEMLGGKRRAVSVYGSSMDRVMPEEDEAARMKRLYEQGVGAFKLHCAHPNGKNIDTRPGRTERVVKLVRETIGSAELYVDVNGNYSPEFAVSKIPFLKEHGVSILEEPCEYWELEQTREVHKAAQNMGILISGGEQDYMLPQWRAYCNPPAVDVVQPDICYIGGFSRALLVANMSEAGGQRSTPHCANRSMLPVFSSHYLCVVENGFPFMEYSIESEPWTDGVVEGLPPLDKGKFTPSEKPGWGVSINSDWLKKSAYQITQ